MKQILGVSVYNWDATATCHPGFVHPCHQVLKCDSMKFVQSGQRSPYWDSKPEPPIYNVEVLITWLWQDPSNHWAPLTLPHSVQLRRLKSSNILPVLHHAQWKVSYVDYMSLFCKLSVATTKRDQYFYSW